MLKVGVIGAGSMGRHHVRVYSELDNCRLVGVADPDPAKAALAAQYGAPFFADHRGLLDLQPELVTIAAPTSLHYELACEALDAGCHLLIEKPISDDLTKARALVTRAAAAGRRIAIGHIERFNPAVVELQRQIDSGELGDVLAVNNLRVGPYHNRILDTGIILDIGIHDVDLISMLLHAQPRQVYATAMRRVHTHEDHAVLHLAYPNSVTGVVETSWLAPYRARNIFVVGTRHFALVDLINQVFLVYEDNPQPGALLAGMRQVPKGEPLRNELASVVASVIDGTEPLCTAADSILALQACLAALASLASGQAEPVCG